MRCMAALDERSVSRLKDLEIKEACDGVPLPRPSWRPRPPLIPPPKALLLCVRRGKPNKFLPIRPVVIKVSKSKGLSGEQSEDSASIGFLVGPMWIPLVSHRLGVADRLTS